jgi:hypothetical protein
LNAAVTIKDLGERQVQNDLARLIRDLDGMVPWILAPGCEHPFEISGSAQRFAVGRRHTGGVFKG